MSRILTQCSTADLKAIIEFSLSQKEGSPTPQLNKKQGAALLAVAALTHAGLTFEEIHAIRELIFWDNGTWIFKFHKTPKAQSVKNKLSEPKTRNLIQEKLAQIGTKLET